MTPDKDFSLMGEVSPCWKIPLKERVTFILGLKGNTQSWLADQVGINKGTLSKIMNGSWYPSSKVMLKMAEVLGCDSLVLFGDTKYYLDYKKSITKTEEKNES